MFENGIKAQLKEIINLALPVISIRIFYIFVGVVGMWIIGHLGKVQLAAGALVTTITTTIIVIALSPLFSVSIQAGKLYGAKNFIQIGDVLRQAWLISAFLSLITGIVLWNISKILIVLNQPAEVIPYVQGYMHGLAWGIFPSFLIACCHQLCFAIQRQKLVVIWGACSFVLTLLFGIGCVYGYGGLPALGFCGWSYGGAIANWIMLFGVLIYLTWSQSFREFRIFDFAQKINIVNFCHMLNLSWPITIQFSGELFAFSILNIMVGWLGTSDLGLQQIITQCSTLALMIPMGASQACTILTSQALGSERYEKINAICLISTCFITACMLMIACLYWFAPVRIIGVYINLSSGENSHLAVLGSSLLFLLAFTQIADAIRHNLIGALRGLQDVFQPMLVNIILLWGVGIPVAYWLAFHLKLGILGINTGFLVAFTLGAIFMFSRFKMKTRQYSTMQPTVLIET